MVLAARGGWPTTKAGTTYAKVGKGRWGGVGKSHSEDPEPSNPRKVLQAAADCCSLHVLSPEEA